VMLVRLETPADVLWPKDNLGENLEAYAYRRQGNQTVFFKFGKFKTEWSDLDLTELGFYGEEKCSRGCVASTHFPDFKLRPEFVLEALKNYLNGMMMVPCEGICCSILILHSLSLENAPASHLKNKIQELHRYPRLDLGKIERFERTARQKFNPNKNLGDLLKDVKTLCETYDYLKN